ncbi:hypothetical protein AYI68_g4214 [Smittium mucronatum]|uniref:Uncharacterized protein n=1 Tax=Smittium mucronatum TaxID=133383 RepID=A0A1R0GXV5_9FUNG|nr:hypothetical protein AYI68_g4214 [Smittium mucronatum]
MEHHGRPQRLVETGTKPLVNQEKLDSFFVSEKPEKSSRIRKPFQRRQQSFAQGSTTESLRRCGIPKLNFRLFLQKTTRRHQIFTVEGEVGEEDPKDGTVPHATALRTTTADVASEISLLEDSQRIQLDSEGEGSIFSLQELHRRSKIQRPSILKSAVCNSK